MQKKVYVSILSLLMIFSLSFVLAVPAINAQGKKDKKLSKEDKRKQAEANKLMAEGDMFYRQKNYVEAIGRYDAALAVVPQIPFAHFSKGYAYFFLKDYDRSIESLGKAQELGYTPLEVYKVRWFVRYAKKDYAGALIDVQEALKLDPSNAGFYQAKGDIFRDQNSDKSAIEAYQKAAQLDPNNADLHYIMALTYAKLGDTTQQGVAAAKAIEKGTKFAAESWVLVGDAYQKSKKYDSAADAYERALLAKQDYLQAYVNLGDVYRLLDKLPDAISAMKRGIKVFPTDGSLYTSLSWYYSLSDKHVDAIAAAQQAIKYAPDQYMGYTFLCRAFNDNKQYPQAVNACTSALKLNPGDGETNFYLGRAYEFQNKTDLASQHYNKAVNGLLELTKNTPDSDAFYLLGNSYASLGNKTGAIAAYNRCLSITPKFAKARYNLAIALFQSGDKAGAREQYNELLKIDPPRAEKLLEIIGK